jgi:hypothetical protein
VVRPDDRHWHDGADLEINLYARSLQKAAKTLVESLDLEPNPKTAWDAGPVVVLYRQAVELRLKDLVGDGGKFLPSPTDPITLYTTHAVRWLTQLVCQIIKTLGCYKLGRAYGWLDLEGGAMGKINIGRVLLGVIVAGIVGNILGYLVDGLMLAPQWSAALKALGRPEFSVTPNRDIQHHWPGLRSSCSVAVRHDSPPLWRRAEDRCIRGIGGMGHRRATAQRLAHGGGWSSPAGSDCDDDCRCDS